MIGHSFTAAESAKAGTPESHARRVLGRIGTNPVTWLQHQVEKAADISPETRSHIRGQFKKLRAKHGRLFSLSDEMAEREYIRISYRLNFMRTQEKIFAMKVTDKGYHTACKTLGIFAAATLKYKGDNGKGGKGKQNRKPVPTAATSHTESEADGSDGEEES